ncbi:hypothetical protein ABZ135_34720 [Streptomyces sp. NPDC006339]|uniref:hypothetical protein n=1 Tax=Streptomyces sp. NPDC006339 TaxID=3156755 RepID=UPI0033AC44CC
MTAVTWVCLVFLAGVALVTWASSHGGLVRTPAQVEADVAHYRAQRRMQEAVDSLRTCQAIWDATTDTSHRKETDQ